MREKSFAFVRSMPKGNIADYLINTERIRLFE